MQNLAGTRVDRVVATDDAVQLELRGTATTGRCPACQRRSRRVHSTYTRRITDLSLTGRTVIVYLRVRRFRCVASD